MLDWMGRAACFLFFLLSFHNLKANEASTGDKMLRSRLNEIEIKTCRQMAQQFSELRTCHETGQCDQVYRKFYKNGVEKSPRNFSFKQLLQTGNGFKKTLKAAGISAAAWTYDISLWALTTKGIKAVTHLGSKIAIGVAGGALITLGWIVTPGMTLHAVADKCDDDRLLDDKKGSESCAKSAAAILDHKFRREIEQGLKDPETFASTLQKKEDGLGARLACSIIENILDVWQGAMGAMKCQGRTLMVGLDQYLIHSDGYIYRHQGMSHTLFFGKNGQSVSVEPRHSGSYQHRLTEKEKFEARDLRAMAPRIREVIKTCSVQPDSELDLSSPVSN